MGAYSSSEQQKSKAAASKKALAECDAAISKLRAMHRINLLAAQEAERSAMKARDAAIASNSGKPRKRDAERAMYFLKECDDKNNMADVCMQQIRALEQQKQFLQQQEMNIQITSILKTTNAALARGMAGADASEELIDGLTDSMSEINDHQMTLQTCLKEASEVNDATEDEYMDRLFNMDTTKGATEDKPPPPVKPPIGLTVLVEEPEEAVEAPVLDIADFSDSTIGNAATTSLRERKVVRAEL